MAYLETTASVLSWVSHLSGSYTVGSVRRYGFQSSCNINNIHVFSQHIPFHFSLFLVFTSIGLVLRVSRITVSKLCKSTQWTDNVWMNGFGLYGFSGTFSLLLYFRIVLDLLYYFSLRERFRLTFIAILWWLFVNCTEFTIILFVLFVGIPYKICILWLCFSLGLWKIKLYSFKSLSSPQHFVCRAMIKRNLKTVNKYYCVEIWMSLQNVFEWVC